MTRPGPVSPSWGIMVFLALFYGFAAAMGVGSWRLSGWVGPRSVSLWLLGWQASMAIGLLPAYVALASPKAARWLGESGRAGWALFYGLFAVGGCLGTLALWGFCRLAGLTAIPVGLWAWTAGTNILVFAGIAWFGEQDAASRQALLREESLVEGDLRRVWLAREVVRIARERVRRNVQGMLETRVTPALRQLVEELGHLAQMPPAEALAALPDIRDRLDRLRERELRLASHQLHPSAIDVGMAPALHILATAHEVDLPIALDVPPEAAEIDPGARLLLYRCAQEGIENVVHHARATRAAIGLEKASDGAWLLRVRDDGVGVNSGAFQVGGGLRVLASRVQLAGGSWSLEPLPGLGSELTVRILPRLPD